MKLHYHPISHNCRRWYDAIQERDAWQRSAPPPTV